jgi:hypothetical protein
MTWHDVVDTILLSVTFFVNMAFTWSFNGNSTIREISDDRKSKFTPPHATFLIWLLIYGSQGLFMIWQLKDQTSLNQTIWIFYLILSIANILWCYFFSSKKIGYSIVMSIFMIFSLQYIYEKLNITYTFVGQNNNDKWINFPTFSIYYGWMWVALFANIFTAGIINTDNKKEDLEENKPTKLSKENLAVVIFALILTLLSQSLLFRYGDVYFAGAILWGLLGILYTNWLNERIFYHLVFVNLLNAVLIGVKISMIFYA